MYPFIKLETPIIVQPEIKCDEFRIIKVEEVPGDHLIIHFEYLNKTELFTLFNENTFNPEWTDEDIAEGLVQFLSCE